MEQEGAVIWVTMKDGSIFHVSHVVPGDDWTRQYLLENAVKVTARWAYATLAVGTFGLLFAAMLWNCGGGVC